MREEYVRGQLLKINPQELTTEEWAEIKKSHPGIKYLFDNETSGSHRQFVSRQI